ncbi:hypothetical protein ACJW31_06G105600 [Castanea mollissima]
MKHTTPCFSLSLSLSSYCNLFLLQQTQLPVSQFSDQIAPTHLSKLKITSTQIAKTLNKLIWYLRESKDKESETATDWQFQIIIQF